MGVKLTPEAKRDALSACAVWMFDSLSEMPGNYTPDEFSENSPVRSIASFPQDLVMVGRAAVLIRGICAFFDIPWSVSRAWAPLARWKLHGVPMEEESEAQRRVMAWVDKVKLLGALLAGVLGRIWAGSHRDEMVHDTGRRWEGAMDATIKELVHRRGGVTSLVEMEGMNLYAKDFL